MFVMSFFHSSAPSDMRYSVDLCNEENDFRNKRKYVVFQAMKKLLGESGPQTLDEVNIRTLVCAHYTAMLSVIFSCI